MQNLSHLLNKQAKENEREKERGRMAKRKKIAQKTVTMFKYRMCINVLRAMRVYFIRVLSIEVGISPANCTI